MRRWNARVEDFVVGAYYLDYNGSTVNTLPTIVRLVEIGGKRFGVKTLTFETIDGERIEHRSDWGELSEVIPLGDKRVVSALKSKRAHTLRRIEKWTKHVDVVDALIAQVEATLQQGGDA